MQLLNLRDYKEMAIEIMVGAIIIASLTVLFL